MPKSKSAKQARLKNIEKARLQKVQNTKESLQAPADETRPSVGPDTNIFEFDRAPAATNHLHASHISRKSERMIRRHKKAKRDLEAKGFFSLLEFFRRKAEGMRQQDNAKAVQTIEQEEEEEEEEEAETMRSACSAEPEGSSTPGAVSTHAPSSDNPSDSENDLGSCWGPSRTILYESEESSCSDETPSDVEDPQSAATRELDGLRWRDALNEITMQHPRNNAMGISVGEVWSQTDPNRV
ncbi:hypothetical protein EDB85DRAFT_2163139 [Lactarius pseudohatsudake]|nr:hypothetical protein EDB85DRAFT_2163139 [Lactarius pseudohatsudake]